MRRGESFTEFANRTRYVKPRQQPVKGLVIGQWSDGRKHVISNDERFSTHTHLIGPSGFGKSYCLYSLICQDILAGRGVCVIDPHSELYLMLINFLVQQRIDPKRVICINPLLADWTVKMNPLESWDGLGSGRDLATESMIRVAGETTFQHTPRLRKYLRAATHVLEQAQQPLALLPWFCSTHPLATTYRRELIRGSDDWIAELVWEEFEWLTPMQKGDHLDSTKNRAMPFADDRRIHQMMAYADNNIDWQDVMDKGAIVLCNLGDIGGRSISQDARQLVGILINHSIGRAARRRPNGRERPFCVYCDEFGSYVSEDFADALDGLRKFGVFFTLAHQRLKQVEIESPNVMDSILNNCRIKLIFGGLAREAAEQMGKEIFTGYVDGDQVKYQKATTSFRPVLEWMDIMTQSEGGSDSTGGSSSYSWGSTSGSSATQGTSVTQTPDGVIFGSSSSTADSHSFQEAVSQADNWSSTRSWSRSASRVPVTTFEEFFQPADKQFYSLEEQWEKKYALLMNLAARSVVVKLQGQPPVIVPTIDIHDRISSRKLLAEYEAAVCERCPYIVRATEAKAEIERLLRHHELTFGAIEQEPTEFNIPESSVELQPERKPKQAVKKPKRPARLKGPQRKQAARPVAAELIIPDQTPVAAAEPEFELELDEPTNFAIDAEVFDAAR